MGDGYLAGQMALFATHANSGLVDLLEQEPFKTYQTFFNAYRVDVVSNEAGVDNDPVQGIQRDTALDMGFWCSGIAQENPSMPPNRRRCDPSRRCIENAWTA